MNGKTIVTYQEFIRMVAKDTGFTIANVNDCIKSMERCICEALINATPENEISLKYMPHAEASRVYVKPSRRNMPNGKTVTAGDKMTTNVRFTPFLKSLDLLTAYSEEDEEILEEEPVERQWYEEDDF